MVTVSSMQNIDMSSKLPHTLFSLCYDSDQMGYAWHSWMRTSLKQTLDFMLRQRLPVNSQHMRKREKEETELGHDGVLRLLLY